MALTPRACLLRRRLSNGAVIYGRNRAGFGGRGVYIFGDDLEPELRHLDEFLDESGVFVDVGANTGVYTLKAAKHFSNKGLVIAVEPFIDTLAVLAASVQKNRFTNVRLRCMCVGETTREATLWMNFAKPNSFSLLRRTPSAAPLSVFSVTLDDLSRWEGLRRLDYLKIDAEGLEESIIRSGSETIDQFRPIIQVEVTLRDVDAGLRDYLSFRAPGSQNRLLIPSESDKAAVARGLGWSNPVV